MDKILSFMGGEIQLSGTSILRVKKVLKVTPVSPL